MDQLHPATHALSALSFDAEAEAAPAPPPTSVTYPGTYSGEIVESETALVDEGVTELRERAPSAASEPKMGLSLHDILAGGRPKTKLVYTPEYDGFVEVSALTTWQQDELGRRTKLLQDREGNTAITIDPVRAQAIVWCVRNPYTHEPLFDKTHIPFVHSLDSAIATRWYGAINEISTVTQEEMKRTSERFLLASQTWTD